jgi:arsenate reductase
MAEGIARHLHGDLVEAYSAGTSPTSVNPRAVKVMGEIGIDISGYGSKSLAEFVEEPFDYVITLCGSQADGTCPVFPGEAKERLHWGLPDPAQAQGSEEEVLPVFRQVRDEVRARLSEFATELRREEVLP